MAPGRRQLAVNADDFGFTRDVNEGIVHAHREGILTSTTLMANGAAFHHAVELAHATPSLDIGVHFVLVGGPGQPETVPQLIRTLLRRQVDVYATLRAQINSGAVRFVDMHLSQLPQNVRYGFLGPVHWAVVEAADITPGGGIVLTTSVGAANTYLHCAEKVLIELNRRHPPTLLGMHDIFEPKDPPARSEIPIFSASDRAGAAMVIIDPKKIAGVVETNLDDEGGGFDARVP